MSNLLLRMDLIHEKSDSHFTRLITEHTGNVRIDEIEFAFVHVEDDVIIISGLEHTEQPFMCFQL